MNRIKKPRISPAGRQSKLSSIKKNYNLSTGILSRLARASTGDHLTDFVSQMQLIARIANGIALQVGLMDMSLPVDDVITELLRMGSIKLQDLFSMDFSGMNEVINKSKESSTKLVENTGVTGIENRFINTNLVIRTNFSPKAFKTLAGKTEYNNLLEQVSNSSLSETEVEAPIKNVNELKGSLATIAAMKSDQDKTLINDECLILQQVYSSFVKVESAIKNYQAVISFVADLKKLSESSFAELMIKEHETRKYFEDTYSDKVAEAEIENNFLFLEEFCQLIEKNVATLTKFHNLAEVFRSGQPGLQYTAGFPNGFGDLDTFFRDLDNLQFQKNFNVSLTTSRDIRKGLKPLDQLRTSLATMNNGWKPVNNTIDASQKLISEQLGIANLTTQATLGREQIKQILTCDRSHTRKFDVFVNIKPLIDAILKLNEHVNKLSDFGAVNKLVDLSVVKKVVDFNGETDIIKMRRSTPGKVKNLRAMPELADTINNLNQFSTDANALKNIMPDVKLALGHILSNIQLIDSYRAEVILSGFLEWNACLHEHVKSGEVVSEMIKTIKTLRIDQTQKIADTETFVKTIFNSTSPLKFALNVANSMKNVTEFESKALRLFDKSREVSHTLGMTARGFAAIKKAVDSEKKLGSLTGDVSYIQTSAALVRSRLSQDEYNGLMNVISLQEDLTKMYTAIGALDKPLSALDETDLTSYTAVFQAAANVPGVNVDVQKLKKAVEALKRKDRLIQSKLGEVSTALDVLEPLDLDFASFKSKSPSAALSDLNLFFAKLTQSLATSNRIVSSTTNAPGAPPTPSANSLASGGSLGALAANTLAAAGIKWSLYIGVGAILGIGIFLIVVGATIFCYLDAKKMAAAELKRKKKERREFMNQALFFASDLVVSIEHFMKASKLGPLGYLEDQLRLFHRIGLIHAGNTREDANIDKRRYKDMYCIATSAVELKPEKPGQPEIYINANILRMDGEVEWMMAQGPLCGSEVGKVSTLKEHWMMIDQKNVKIVVQLCNFSEANASGYFVEKCARYYPDMGQTMDCGGYALKTLEKINIASHFTCNLEKEAITMWKVQFIYKGKTKTVDILRYFAWQDHSVPKSVDTAYEIVKLCDSYKGAVLVHCSAGVGRTGTLVGVKKGMEMCETDDHCELPTILVTLRDSRYNAVQTKKQIMYMAMAITKGLMTKHGWGEEEFIPCYYSLLYYYEKIVGDKYPQESFVLKEEDIKQEIKKREEFVAEAKAKWEAEHPNEKKKREVSKRKKKKKKVGKKSSTLSATKSVEAASSSKSTFA